MGKRGKTPNPLAPRAHNKAFTIRAPIPESEFESELAKFGRDFRFDFELLNLAIVGLMDGARTSYGRKDNTNRVSFWNGLVLPMLGCFGRKRCSREICEGRPEGKRFS
jgi:hypothetical protein